MTDASLTFYAAWASIISLFVSLVSLVYVRSIKKNIVKYKRKQRLQQLIDGALRIPTDAGPLNAASITALVALKRNVPLPWWAPVTQKGRAASEVHRQIDARDVMALREAIKDWASFLGDI